MRGKYGKPFGASHVILDAASRSFADGPHLKKEVQGGAGEIKGFYGNREFTFNGSTSKKTITLFFSPSLGGSTGVTHGWSGQEDSAQCLSCSVKNKMPECSRGQGGREHSLGLFGRGLPPQSAPSGRRPLLPHEVAQLCSAGVKASRSPGANKCFRGETSS